MKYWKKLCFRDLTEFVVVLVVVVGPALNFVCWLLLFNYFVNNVLICCCWSVLHIYLCCLNWTLFGCFVVVPIIVCNYWVFKKKAVGCPNHCLLVVCFVVGCLFCCCCPNHCWLLFVVCFVLLFVPNHCWLVVLFCWLFPIIVVCSQSLLVGWLFVVCFVLLVVLFCWLFPIIVGLLVVCFVGCPNHCLYNEFCCCPNHNVCIMSNLLLSQSLFKLTHNVLVSKKKKEHHLEEWCVVVVNSF